MTRRRPYYGSTDLRTSARPGTKRFAEYLTYLHGSRTIGIYANRNIAGSPRKSVHATGRAFDQAAPADGRRAMLEFLDTHCRHAVQAVHDYENDYQPGEHGAAYRCDRDAWKTYERPTIKPAGAHNTWIHVELEPFYADSPDEVDNLFRSIFK
jgi:hypothetical protein